ncbi:DNA helicase PcrA [Defluviitalea saccharophila]|uniref:ATP-dependent DNA helicase n=1 Tax=Defluviitalea saccharophila TaxID=879970 RepID=A0ABZ2YAN3_9FIRM|nr:DNA helicase PcrA [Candidatus Epulonipiscium sp.]
MRLVEGLNPKQKEAVLQTEGPVLILAGAGSGKTRVLTHRIAYLIQEKNILPWKILAITFTNKAAKEMRERVDQLVGKGAEEIWVSTFHSACVKILRRDIDKIGYNRYFTIYDTGDQKSLIKECLKELNYNEKNYPVSYVLGEISNQKNELVSASDYEKNSAGDFRKEKLANIYKLYQKKLESNNALDFDDIIFKTVELFIYHPEVLEYYQNRFEYIMVDEYQDTNTAQYKLVKLLASKHHNLCVVGDDDQSIYGWRGANIRNILDFEKDFKNAKVIKLEQNYRSTKVILDAANAVIKNNFGRKSKALWTENEQGDLIDVRETDNEHDEAEFVANEIVKQIEEEGREYKDFAVLYRTNAQSRVLEEHFIKHAIPYRLLGGVRFYERKEIKDLLGYLRVIQNPSDDLSLKRIINVPKRGIGDTTIGKVEAFASDYDMSFFDAIRDVEIVSQFGRSASKLKKFADLIGVFQVEAQAGSVMELVENILERTGYLKELENENTEESKERIQNIKELISKAADYDQNAEEPSLEGFLEEVSLVADIDNYNEANNAVVLMTLHSAKGLEFPYVFITGLEEGIFPSYMSVVSENEDAVEEERRLCYVGITRARQKLYLCYAKSRMLRGLTQYNRCSRFISELPKDLISIGNKVKKAVDPLAGIRSRNKVLHTYTPYQGAVSKADNSSSENTPLEFECGDLVKHIKFGVGTVEDIRYAGADYEVTVTFPKFGSKKLMARLAKLKLVQ